MIYRRNKAINGCCASLNHIIPRCAYIDPLHEACFHQSHCLCDSNCVPCRFIGRDVGRYKIRSVDQHADQQALLENMYLPRTHAHPPPLPRTCMHAHTLVNSVSFSLSFSPLLFTRTVRTPYTHTHTLTHTHTHARTHARSHARTRARTHTHTHRPEMSVIKSLLSSGLSFDSPFVSSLLFLYSTSTVAFRLAIFLLIR